MKNTAASVLGRCMKHTSKTAGDPGENFNKQTNKANTMGQSQLHHAGLSKSRIISLYTPRRQSETAIRDLRGG